MKLVIKSFIRFFCLYYNISLRVLSAGNDGQKTFHHLAAHSLWFLQSKNDKPALSEKGHSSNFCLMFPRNRDDVFGYCFLPLSVKQSLGKKINIVCTTTLTFILLCHCFMSTIDHLHWKGSLGWLCSTAETKALWFSKLPPNSQRKASDNAHLNLVE